MIFEKFYIKTQKYYLVT